MTLSLVALALAGGTWLWYLALIPNERVPARPVAHALLMIGSIGLALFGLGRGLGVAVAAGLAILLAGYFLYLLTISVLPAGELAVSVGDRLPSFSVHSDSGVAVGTETWLGGRVMLKVFRGGW